MDFKNTVLIMTSNLGTADLRKASIGFAKTSESVTYEKMKEKVNDALKQHFRPEFLNRIDEVIVFHELSRDEVAEILDIQMVRRLQNQLEGQGLGLELTPAAKLHLVDKGHDPAMGAQSVRNLHSASGIRLRSPFRTHALIPSSSARLCVSSSR